MEALNAAGLTPLSVLSDRRKQPTKFSSLPTVSACKVSSFCDSSNKKQALQECLTKGLHGGLFLASSVVNGGIATALTYEEALSQSVTAPSSGDFDANGFVDSVISFATENPAILAGGVAILAVPVVLSQVLKKPKPWGVEQVGSPDVGGLRKKTVSIAYKGEDKPGFLKKLSLKFKEPENTTLFILDKVGHPNGFKAAYAIKDGAEGPRGWTNSGLPWIEPRKAASLDFGNLTDALSEAIGDTSDGLAVALGIAAATGLGFLAFTEIETILQLLGSAALVQFASKKLLFAEDRKNTLKQVDEFLNTKVAPKELVDEITQIGKALLPTSTNNKALPAPAESSPELATADSTVQKAAATPEADTVSESKIDAAPEVNSVPKTEIKAESDPVQPRPLSPYPNYPDFKPPTSPSPPDTVSESKIDAAPEPAPEVNSVPKTEIKAESVPEQPRPLSPYPYYPDFKPPTSPSPSQP
ncbi:Rhodanese-like domain superfamily [Sesbania bispinosa]|nr:Rhodanese-like domain superfamily [Sesbania bispinosa]